MASRVRESREGDEPLTAGPRTGRSFEGQDVLG